MVMHTELTEIETECNICHNKLTLIVPTEGFEAWMKGEYVQDALPMLNPAERELLISGTCEPCFDSLFGEEN
ncbi:MAG: hypothetical protein Unbinned400contig1000_7 [Prokaryotic dsDNA virus sp.]|nr:MAG: hypothetical protein Unbinned400contig1000_7 [Prokaryotic dsDNA virus sp.]|tara:strand:+ start:1253 stop:1468 length:216 start_codon:yes stop_codon:yes gene_type:complete